MRPVVYNHAQITDWLGAHTVAKARPYYRSVSHVFWSDNVLNGRVQAALADAILSEDPGHAAKFGAQELEALFAPLPSLSASSA